ncbi:MAG: hypothetical protein HMLKMBBP_03490 [Planctomycetes bacterium]|nr:hypothetical protein [Planctomycetota bacterium]
MSVDREVVPPPTRDDINNMPEVVKGELAGTGCWLRVRQIGPIHYSGVLKPNSLGGPSSVSPKGRCWCYGGSMVGWEEIHEYRWRFDSDPPSGLRLCQDGSIEHRLYDANGRLCEVITDWIFETWPAGREGRKNDSHARTFVRSLICGDMIGCTVASSAKMRVYFARLKDKKGELVNPDNFSGHSGAGHYEAESRSQRHDGAQDSYHVTKDGMIDVTLDTYGDCNLWWSYDYRVSHCDRGTGWQIDRSRGPGALAAFWSNLPSGRSLTMAMPRHATRFPPTLSRSSLLVPFGVNRSTPDHGHGRMRAWMHE